LLEEFVVIETRSALSFPVVYISKCGRDYGFAEFFDGLKARVRRVQVGSSRTT
jgi:hypothetical protein